MTIEIDVIIPTFNRASTLERAIQSVLNQTHKLFNLYIVDDGSTDETTELVSKYLSDRIHYYKQENKGVSAARNSGIQSSQSAWVTFLDSDDEWLPQKLSTQLKYLNDHPAFRFFHSNEIWIRNGVRVNPPARFDKSNNEIFKRSLETCLISPSTTLIHRSLLSQMNGFDESFEICEDYDLWLKILATEPVNFIPDHLVKKYGGHEDQLSLKFPAMDLWRIKSMLNLLQITGISEEKVTLIENEINRKAEILLPALIKHKQFDQHEKLVEMLNRIKSKKS